MFERKAVELLHSLIEQSSRLRSTNQMNVANYLLKLAEIRMVCTIRTISVVSKRLLTTVVIQLDVNSPNIGASIRVIFSLLK